MWPGCDTIDGLLEKEGDYLEWLFQEAVMRSMEKRGRQLNYDIMVYTGNGLKDEIQKLNFHMESLQNRAETGYNPFNSFALK